ncbi:FAD-binding domain-containing protein [Elstera litoralis]|uniref:FAD-binding domain-containing protein n=1 Tax=Elstera litoralis TaxID=552518 RepID=UPI0006977DC5|nr:FAD-binding domain-containing protein [Elstera litoralis]
MLLAAWTRGETGIPFIDACMRALVATGWINFRMRAMLCSFAAYQLWQDWRLPAQHLARCFIDYEPGIHYPQVQMQSGTTGINTLRIYNPVKQGLDHDPEGVFLRKWLPELADLPTPLLHEPWKAETPLLRAAGVRLDSTYPRPIVESEAAARFARQTLWALRRGPEFRSVAANLVEKHGSRKRPPSAGQTVHDSRQGSLFDA